jgi:hypothetical protein
MKTLLIIVFSLLAFSASPISAASETFADSHIHFNWDHRAETSAAQVVEILQQHNVGLTIVAGTPSELALELREKGGDWIIPFFSPIYTRRASVTGTSMKKSLTGPLPALKRAFITA